MVHREILFCVEGQDPVLPELRSLTCKGTSQAAAGGCVSVPVLGRTDKGVS